jgi:hypothetical protein
MKLFVFEYYGFCGGAIVVIAPDVNTAENMINKEVNKSVFTATTIFVDFLKTSWFKILTRIPGNLEGMPKEQAIKNITSVVNQFAPENHKASWTALILEKLNNPRHSFDNGLVRMDWVLSKFKEKLEYGCYLTDEIEVKDNEQPRIVSHSYYD